MGQLRGRLPLFVLVTVLAGSLTGCTWLARYQLGQARRLEEQGKTQQAINAYSKVLESLPADQEPLRSRVYYRIGECLWRQGQTGDAVKAFERSADADKNNLVVHLRLGEIYLAGGAPHRATEQAHKVLQLASASVDGLALLGAASSAAGDNAMARDAFSRVLASDPRRVSIAVALADVYNRENRIDEAREVLRKAAKAQPSSAMPWLALGRLEEQEGNVPEAEDSYRHAVAAEDTRATNLKLAIFLERTARVSEAESVLQRADVLRPKLPIALSDFQFISGRPDVALDRYTTALRSPLLQRKWSENPNLWRESLYGNGVAAARASLAARVVESDLRISDDFRHDAPETSANTAAAKLHLDAYRNELDPGTVEILEAEIAFVSGDTSSARMHAEKAVKLAADSAPAHYVLGIVRQRMGDEAGARDQWGNALNIDSEYIPARLALTAQSYAEGDFPSAEDYIVPVVQEEPGNLRGLQLFAQVLAAQHRFDSAAVIARRALALDSRSAMPHVLLGNIALGQNHPATALAAFERALKLDPHSSGAIDGLIKVYRQGGATRSMILRLEHLAQEKPKSAALFELAGRMYSQIGLQRDARRCFRNSLAADSRRSSAAASLAVLQAEGGHYAAALTTGAKVGGATASLLRAVEFQENHAIVPAMQQYELAVQGGDPTGVASNNLAWLLVANGGDLTRALRLAEHARRMAPGDPAVLDTLGYVYLKRREYSEAIRVLKEANIIAVRQKAPADQVTTIREHLSEAYFRAGQNGEAADLRRHIR